jgi:hypothetical protein
VSTIVDFSAKYSPQPAPSPGEALSGILTWAALHQPADRDPQAFLRLVVEGSRQYAARHGLDDRRDGPHRLMLALAGLEDATPVEHRQERLRRVRDYYELQNCNSGFAFNRGDDRG